MFFANKFIERQHVSLQCHTLSLWNQLYFLLQLKDELRNANEQITLLHRELEKAKSHGTSPTGSRNSGHPDGGADAASTIEALKVAITLT